MPREHIRHARTGIVLLARYPSGGGDGESHFGQGPKPSVVDRPVAQDAQNGMICVQPRLRPTLVSVAPIRQGGCALDASRSDAAIRSLSVIALVGISVTASGQTPMAAHTVARLRTGAGICWLA